MKRYLVTGGAGFIGSSIVKKLLDEKNIVRIFDNEFRGDRTNIDKNSNAEFVKGDIRDLDAVKKACKNIDTIIHLAYINGTKFFYEKPDLVLDVGVKGMINILEGARENSVKELFLASSSEVYQTPSQIPTPEDVAFSIPDPLNPRYSYAGGKIISELMTLHVGSTFLKKAVVIRPHNVYGPRMGYEHVIPELITKIIELKKNEIVLPIQGDGESSRSFIYIDDFSDAVMLLLKKGKNKEIYNIGTEQEIKIKDLVEMLGDVAKKEIKIKQSDQPAGGTKRRCPDTSKLRKLGFKDKITLIDGLTRTFLWYNDHLNNRKD